MSVDVPRGKTSGRRRFVGGAASTLALCALVVACGRVQPTPPTAPLIPPTGGGGPPTYTLAWSDEFDGVAGTLPDPLKWGYDTGDGCPDICGWGNREKEYYTRAPENASLNGQGQLAIVARVAAPGLKCYYGACQYSSAKLTTRGKMSALPGRVEARIRIPAGQGLWPAFWMLGSNFPTTPWPACGEIDIMENHGSKPQSTSSAMHGPGYFGGTPFAHDNPIDDSYANDFHVFAVEWDGARATFFMDGKAHYSVLNTDVQRYGAWVFNQSFFVILNLAVGGNFDGDPQSNAILPATMLVDYVRVYTRS